MKIKGWRTSLKEVKEFVFTFNKKEAYSTKLGAEESNMGVIGLAFFKEKKPAYSWCGTATTIWPPQYSWTTTTANSDPTLYGSVTGVTNAAAYTVNTSNGPTLTRSASAGTSNSLGSASNGSYDNVVTMQSFSAGTAQGSAQQDSAVEVDKEFLETPEFTDAIYYDTRENLVANGIIKEVEDKMPEPFANTRFCPPV